MKAKKDAYYKRMLQLVYRPERGPFDIIGDIHGCFLELVDLLDKLGYVRDGGRMAYPDGRQAVFLGDLTDRGPYNVSTILLVEGMVRNGTALYVPGNHCRKLYRHLSGANVVVQHGLETTVRELEALPLRERRSVRRTFRRLYDNSPPYMILDEGRLVVAHAGIRENLIGKMSKQVESVCLYGERTGERTPDGFPIRRDWVREYRGRALVVYGHTPVREAMFRYNTINIDQGCVFGGKLTALRYPELEIVQVSARTAYDPRVAFREMPPEPPKADANGVTPADDAKGAAASRGNKLVTAAVNDGRASDASS